MGKRKKSSKVRGVENASSVSPSPERESEAAGARATAAEVHNRSGLGPTAELLDLPLFLLDPPDKLARPIDDGEYMASLLESMRAVGQLYPITVTPKGTRFQIVDGMHRFYAAREMGWPQLRVQFLGDTETPQEAVQLHANQLHKQMTAWEEHLFYTRLCEDYHLDFEGLCRYTRKSEKYVSDRLLLANLTEESKEALRRDAISFGAARELLRLKDPAWERYYLDLCLRTGTGTQVLHTWVNQFLQKKELPTQEQVAAAAAPAVAPPPVPLIVCALCNAEPGGRQVVQVWCHLDELQTIVRTIQATFQRAAAAPAPEPSERSREA